MDERAGLKLIKGVREDGFPSKEVILFLPVVGCRYGSRSGSCRLTFREAMSLPGGNDLRTSDDAVVVGVLLRDAGNVSQLTGDDHLIVEKRRMAASMVLDRLTALQQELLGGPLVYSGRYRRLVKLHIAGDIQQ